ncbi:MAG TPA: hypothetical protein VIO60_07725 [Rectinemataceae bacterium]
MKKLGLSIAGLLAVFSLFAQDAASAGGQGVKSHPESILFAQAFELYQRGEFVSSAQAFATLAEPKEGLSDAADPIRDSFRREAAYMEILARVNARELGDAEAKAQAFLNIGASAPQSAELGYQLGRIAFLKADYALAASRFSDVLSLLPSESERKAAGASAHPSAAAWGGTREAALYWKAECLYRLGKAGEALEILQGLARMAPEGHARNLALLRLEIMGLEERRAAESRNSAYAEMLASRRDWQSETAEILGDMRMERGFALTQALRSAYGLSSSRDTRFYAEGKDPLPVPPGPTRAELELARANKLRQLLAAKNTSLELLAAALARFAEEVSK